MATYQKVTHGYFLLHPNPLAFCQAEEQGIIRSDSEAQRSNNYQ